MIGSIKISPLPRATPAALAGEAGIALVTQRFLCELGWMLRRTHQEHDFGIDGHVDIINEAYEATGRYFAVQVKYGSSYFERANSTAIQYYGQLKHLNYYLNYPVPVVVLVLEPGSDEIYWAHVDPAQTRRSGDNWTLAIPRSQKLTSASRKVLDALAGPAFDHTSALAQYWQENEFLERFRAVLLGVSKLEVEQNNVSAFAAMFERLNMSNDLAKQLEGQISIFIHGYDEDPRELWEIAEVRQWFITAVPIIKYWFFFLSRHQQSSALLLFALCTLPVLRLSDGRWELDFSDAEQWWTSHFHWLNEIVARLGLSEKENKRISVEVCRCFFPEYEPPD